MLLLVAVLFLNFARSFQDENFIVNTEKCKMPAYEPFSPEVISLYKPEQYQPCSKIPHLTYITKNATKATLHLDLTVRPLYGTHVNCCVSDVIRKAEGSRPDDKIAYGDCVPFETKIELNSDTVRVQCTDENGKHIFKEVYGTVLRPNDKDVKTDQDRPISVLFVVIDSIARLNLIRTMPETRNYLLNNGFLEMKGYSKIDDNTFPNFMGFMTGYNMTKLEKEKCMGEGLDDLNNCPMLWYNYRDLGYYTAYAEDWTLWGTFNMESRKGFRKPPTTHYYRPYLLASEALGTVNVDGVPYCAGPDTSGERVLDLAKDFAVTFKGDPYFGIFWMNTFSHQRLNAPSKFDKTMRTFFTDLKAEGVLDDSIVVYLADHGMRIESSVRKTLAGWFEERLPMNYISIPKWVQEKFPKEFENLKTNSESKLTTTLDLYMTLQHILELSNLNYTSKPSDACPECKSMFDELPVRGCKEGGIPPEWCTCNGYLSPLDKNNDLVLKGVDYVIHNINSVLQSQNSTLSKKYTVSEVKNAGNTIYVDQDGLKYLFMYFITKPKAQFIVTVRYLEDKDGIEFKEIFRVLKVGGILDADSLEYEEIDLKKISNSNVFKF